MDKDFKKNFIKGSASTFIGQVSSMVFHLVSIMIITRVISKEDFGFYALIIVISSFLAILGTFGLDLTLVKFMSGDKNQEGKSLFTQIFTFKLALHLIIAFLFLILSGYILPFLDPYIVKYSIPIAILFFLGGFRDLFYRILQGLNYFRNYATTQIISALSRLTLIFIFYWSGIFTLDTLILVEILSITSVLLSGIFMIPFRKLFYWKADTLQAKTILNFSMPIFFNDLASFAMNRFNLFIVGAMLNPISVAYYDVGNKIPEALKKISDSFTLVFFPNLSALISKGEKRQAEELINKSLNYIVMLLVPTVLICFLFRTEIVILLFSEKYSESAWLLFLLMFNLSLNVSKNILGYSNLAAGFPKVPMKVNLSSGAISIAGAVTLIPQMGYVGAAYALILMNIFAQTSYLYYLNKIKLKVVIQNYIKPYILMFIAIAVFFVINIDSSSLKLSIVLVYLLLNWIFISDFRALIKSLLKVIPTS